MAFSAKRNSNSSKNTRKRLRKSKEIGNKEDVTASSSSSDTSVKETKYLSGLLRSNARCSSSVVLRSADIKSRLRDAPKIRASNQQTKKQKKIVKKSCKVNRNEQVSEEPFSVKKSSLSPKKEIASETIDKSPKKKDTIVQQTNNAELLTIHHDDVLPCSSQSIEEDFPAFDNLLTRNVGIKNSPQSPNRILPNGFCTPSEATRVDITDLMDADKDTEQRDRRKFYIVQNGGSPAEMYCTDLVHKAKHGYSRARNLDERRLMKCTDKWREEWNHGVQMPLSRERPIYCFEKICLFPDVKVERFVLPKKYIALNERRYTRNAASQFERHKRLSLFQYEIDGADEDWLCSKEGNHVSQEDFLKVINRLEIDCYKNIHITILEQLTFSRDNAKTDDDADCEICCMPEWEPGDEIVFCDDCNMSVHQSCYGLDSVPTDDWMCATCIHRCRFSTSLQGPPPCIFCPILGGAMKCTKNCESWAHVVCALWIPEVRFADVERREPITHVSDVPADRWKAKCSVCDMYNGACIRCTYPGCNIPFHVSCAQRSGLTLQIEQSAQAMNGVRMTSLCSNHSFLSPNRSSIGLRRSSNNFTTFDRNQLNEMRQNFFKHVDLQKISEETGISEKITNDVFMYWHWKRKLNASQPLMVEPLAMKLSVQPKQIRTPQQAARQKSNAFNSLPSEDLLIGFEKIRALRLNLEKARNLCYMVSRREKLKKAQLETFAHSTTTMADLLLDSVVPCSKRRTEKLLEVWDSTNKEMFANEQHSEARSHLSILSLKLANPQEMKAEKIPSPAANTINNQLVHSPRKALYINMEDDGPRYAIRELLSPSSNISLLNGVNFSSKNVKKSVSEEQRRREELYEFRSSNSPLLPNEAPQNSKMPSVREEIDNGNVSDASNFSEYSVAWSNTSENNGALFNFENGISPIRLRNGEKAKKKKTSNGKTPLNGILKVKKVNFKDEQKKSGFNGWKNSGDGGRYVLHHPELRDEMRPLPSRRQGRKRI